MPRVGSSVIPCAITEPAAAIPMLSTRDTEITVLLIFMGVTPHLRLVWATSQFDELLTFRHGFFTADIVVVAGVADTYPRLWGLSPSWLEDIISWGIAKRFSSSGHWRRRYLIRRLRDEPIPPARP